ncbi:MAG: outer membrane protein transport protein [Ignavibacteria bacterium]|nr:outer membrane protein transport protein [Ignavibacteria bacterium]
MKKYNIILFILFISTSVFAQNGTKLIGYDALSMGRGGTSIGIFDTPELMMTNPAGISFLQKSTIAGNFSFMAPQTGFSNSINNDVQGQKNYFPLPSAGYVNKYKESDFSWGIGVYTSGGMGADYLLKNELYRSQSYERYGPDTAYRYRPIKGSYWEQAYHSTFATINGGLSAAYKIADEFSFGITAQLIYSLMEFQMPFGMNPSIMKGVPKSMPLTTFGELFARSTQTGGFGYNEVITSANMTELNTISFGGKIGLAYKPDEDLSFGLTYSLPTKFKYKNGKTSMDMSKQFEDVTGRAVTAFYSQPGAQGLSLEFALNQIAINFGYMEIDPNLGFKADYNVEVAGLEIPQSIGFGLAYKPDTKLSLGLDFEWINWSNAFEKMEIKLTNGSNANINKMMGGPNINIDFPLNWNDAVIIKLGAEYDISKPVTLRVGYAYGNNPVPESTVFPLFPAIVEHHLTLGGSYRFSKNINVNLAFETGLSKELTALNPSLVQSEFNGSSSKLSTILGHVSFFWNF